MESTQTSPTCRMFCTYFAVFVIFVFLGGNFSCSCRSEEPYCGLFLALPFLVTFIFLLWTDTSFQQTSRHLLRSSDCSFLTSSCGYIIRAAFIALLWVACVFITGDWYVCCMSNQTTEVQLACKSPGMITDEELKTIAELKNKSWIIGTILLCGIVLVPALSAMFRWRKPSRGERQKLYHTLILEQEESILKESLRNYAREKLSNKMRRRIQDGQVEECFNVAQQLIQDSVGPVIPDNELQGAQ